MAALRIFFGAAVFLATVRFAAKGWIHEYWEVPTRFFPFWGLSFVRPWSVSIDLFGRSLHADMHVHYALIGLSALAVALGVAYRPACVALALLFGWAHFADKTNYLNHYWFVTSMALALALVPADRAWSLRVLRAPQDRLREVPAWMLWLLRLQVGVVYFYGGVAKLNTDWLLHAQPLTIWLGANQDLPLLGPYFGYKWVCFLFSWCGMLYDILVVPSLLWRPTRPFAYAAVLFFHVVTAKLFQIGIFPWVMIAMSPIFFSADWPTRSFARFGARLPPAVGAATGTRKIAGTAGAGATWPVAMLAGIWCILQLALPLRPFLYAGNRLWTEEGFRFGWNVMLVEKNASIEMWTIDRKTGARADIDSHRWLTPLQHKMMSTQPDMLLTYAHWVAADAAKSGRDVAVHMDVRVAWNGRPSAPLVDPSVDLSREEDTMAPKRWILPAPTSLPEW